MPSLIHHAQSGFTKGRSASSNLRKVLAALEYAKQHPLEDVVIITLDPEKAFDNISFQRISLVMQKLGVSGPFYHFIHSLYSAPSATVIAAGIQSNPIRLHKGMRQGCPLSPLLFNLAMEPLSRYLSTTSSIQGIPFGQGDMRASLFADDILIFTTSPNWYSHHPNSIWLLSQMLWPENKLRQERNSPSHYKAITILVALFTLPHKWETHYLFGHKNWQGTFLSILSQLSSPDLKNCGWIGGLVWSAAITIWEMCAFQNGQLCPPLIPLQTLLLLLKHKDIQILNKANTNF